MGLQYYRLTLEVGVVGYLGLGLGFFLTAF